MNRTPQEWLDGAIEALQNDERLLARWTANPSERANARTIVAQAGRLEAIIEAERETVEFCRRKNDDSIRAIEEEVLSLL